MPSRLFKHAWQGRIVALVFWCAVIFAFSEMPGSGKNIEPPLWYVLERKSAHVFEYAVLAILAWRFFAALYPREAFVRLALLTFSFATMYGALDEFHQFFVFGRGARLSDVAIDSLGAALGLALVYLVVRHRRPMVY